MHRQPLLRALHAYTPVDHREKDIKEKFISFVHANPDCFQRELITGHVTGSAWITDPSGAHCVLVHHQKLDKWLQPGGHTDGEADVAASAQREGMEETGLDPLPFIHHEIFDLDIHRIPERKNEPAHWHYDIRYLFGAKISQALVLSSESRELGWFTLEEAWKRCPEPSVRRMIDKTRRLFCDQQ